MTELQEMTVRELLVALTGVEDEIRQSRGSEASAPPVDHSDVSLDQREWLAELGLSAQRIVDELRSRPAEEPAGIADQVTACSQASCEDGP
jgi:hypothetical protein